MARVTPTLRTTDPFEAGAAMSSTGLETGWLLERSQPAMAAAHGQDPRRAWLGTVGRQLWRWERRAAAQLRPPPHPLADDAVLVGLDAAERQHFLRHFRAFVPAEVWTERWAAERHLESLLPAWPVRRWSDVRGLHLFLGAAGAGKTTLLWSVARQLVRAGQRVTAIALVCSEPPRRAAFASFAAEAGVDASVANSAAELEHLLAATAGSHTVLLDTPCLLTHRARVGAALRHPVLRHPRTLVHLCLSLQHGRAVQARVLRQAAALRFDCLAVSHLDLAAGGGALLAVQLQGPWGMSFAHASATPHVPPLPFGTAALRAGWERGWN